VPAGVTSISVDAYGASGTTAIPDYGGNAYLGKGGRVQTNLTVTPGEVLNIYVGGTTLNYSGSQSNMGGWNGGGNEGGFGRAGGGATDIRIGGTSLSDRVIVSGGGGGRKNEDYSANVGHGGGLVGQKGAYTIDSPLQTPGKGGTQSNGGQGGCSGQSICAAAGTLGSGSNGRSVGGGTSGGGGGGYYGGGGGVDGGGGGGSSYTDPTLCSYVVHTQGARTGKGQLTINISEPILGCTDLTAFNYNASANTDDGSCIAVVNGCTNPTAFNYNALANTDDGSCIAVVNGCMDPTALNYDASANTDDGSCASAIGDTYQGGIIFWLDGNGGGLIAAPSEGAAAWGCWGSVLGATGVAIGTGQQNTVAIEAACTAGVTAADICANLTLNGYSDWFLPSVNELNQLYINRVAIGGFSADLYWSSTEYSGVYAWTQSFANGIQFYAGVKYIEAKVRPVRAF
jgi:hypothetical protein